MIFMIQIISAGALYDYLYRLFDFGVRELNFICGLVDVNINILKFYNEVFS